VSFARAEALWRMFGREDKAAEMRARGRGGEGRR
jgi:hypothetical protein